MFLFDGLDNRITEQLRGEEKVQNDKHKSSGKLSASMLGEPLQWQILKTLGIGQRQIDDYLLRKFEVGRDTEDWFVKRCGEEILERQKFLEYRGAIGYADAIVEAPIALPGKVDRIKIPLEIKSTSNAKFKRIVERSEADNMHKLQAAFYALALNCPYYGITYIATDDRRTHTWIFATADMQAQIDLIIDNYNAQLEKQEVPVFEARYEWQKKQDYNKYPEWMELGAKEINLALDLYYPNAWIDYNAKKATKS